MNRFLRCFMSIFVAAFIGIAATDAFAACGANEYTGPTGSCVTCPAKKNGTNWDDNVSAAEAMIQACGNGTFTCKPWAFRLPYTNTKYLCVQCPSVLNYEDFGLSGSASQSIDVNWSTTEICTFTYSFTDGNGCAGTKKVYPPHDEFSCFWSNSDLPESQWTYENSGASSGVRSCNYVDDTKYTSAPIGYRLTSTSYGNSCTVCGEHEYSPGGNVTSCNQCPHYTANPPSSPFGSGGWSNCGPIIAGFTNTAGTMAPQGIGTGNTCTVGSSTNSNGFGDFVAGACNASGDDFNHSYILVIVLNNNYCQYSNVNDWAALVCGANGMHCSGNACSTCVNNIVANAPDSTHVFIPKDNLYDAQILLSQIASATSMGCLQDCSIY